MREELLRLEAELARQQGTPTNSEALPAPQGPSPHTPGPISDGFERAATSTSTSPPPPEAAVAPVPTSPDASPSLAPDPEVGAVPRPPPRPVSVPPSTSTPAAVPALADRRSLSLDAVAAEAPQLSLTIPSTSKPLSAAHISFQGRLA